jgi:hypothetical protein
VRVQSGSGSRPGGPVASDSTAFRTVDGLASERLLGEIRAEHAEAHERLGKLNGAPERLTIDVDATLICSHSDKESRAELQGWLRVSPAARL